MNVQHLFLTNKKNKFHPIALRPLGLLVFLAIFVIVPFLYNITSAKQFQVLGYATNVTIGDLHALSNQERANSGIASLSLNGTLNNAALAKANDMIAKGYWAHVSPDGTTPWAFIMAAGYQYTVAGENLAKNFNTSSGVVAGWMGSPTHRDNILNGGYRDVGYGVVNGVFQGSETTLVVAMYASSYTPPPAPATPAPAPVQTVTPQQAAPTAPAPVATPAPVQSTPDPVVEQPAPIEESTPDETKTAVNPIDAQPASAPLSGVEGVVAGISASAPVQTYNMLNWGQKVSLLLVSALSLLFIMKHTLVWREQKRGLRHIWLRAHPLSQAAMLTAVAVVTLVSGAGVVL